MYEPSCTSVLAGFVSLATGAGEGLRRALKEDSLLSGRATRSKPTAESGREGAGPGEDGRLAGRKKEGVLSALIIVDGLANAGV